MPVYKVQIFSDDHIFLSSLPFYFLTISYLLSLSFNDIFLHTLFFYVIFYRYIFFFEYVSSHNFQSRFNWVSFWLWINNFPLKTYAKKFTYFFFRFNSIFRTLPNQRSPTLIQTVKNIEFVSCFFNFPHMTMKSGN